MERNMKTPLLFFLFGLPQVCVSKAAPCFNLSLPPQKVICHNDFNHSISCEWDSTNVSDHGNTECKIHAEMRDWYSGECNLRPVDVSRPNLQKCTVVFKNPYRFTTKNVLEINLTCNNMEQISNFFYQPSCHIKLNPPPIPDINYTTVSWFPQVTNHVRVKHFLSEMQWRQGDQSWNDASKQKKLTECDWNCMAEMDTDLIKDEKYEARVRVQAKHDYYQSVWSDWSPIASWVSPTGRPKSTPSPGVDLARSILGTIACMALFLLLLILSRTDKTSWIYIVKRIRGPPLPNPRKSFLKDMNFQSWVSPHFTSESFYSSSKPVDIISVEVTSNVDAVAPSGLEAMWQEKKRDEGSYESTSCSFSNPSYSHVSLPPSVSSLTVGNLEPCAADTPYGPVSGEGGKAEKEMDEVKGKEVEILELLSKGRNNKEPMLEISDYEKVEKPERFRLQSQDSGVCSAEELSQESLEEESVVSGCQDEVPENKVAPNGKVDLQKLFGGSGAFFDKGSIQVSSGYEQVQQLQPDSPELSSVDSGISSGGEEQLSQEESLEDVDKPTESTRLLLPSAHPPPPPLSIALACSLPSFTPLPLNFSNADLSLALQTLPSHTLERMAPMSSNISVEPSGDGYLPVGQGQS